MTIDRHKREGIRFAQTRVLLWLMVFVLAQSSVGCLWLAAGAAAGCGAAGYAYVKGEVHRDFPTPLTTTREVTQKSLNELGYQVKGWRNEPEGTSFETETPDGYPIHVAVERRLFETVSGAFTRVSVRVGVFGDEETSQRILDQVSLHIVPNAGPLASPPAVSLGRIQPVAATNPPPFPQSEQPPLAPKSDNSPPLAPKPEGE